LKKTFFDEKFCLWYSKLPRLLLGITDGSTITSTGSINRTLLPSRAFSNPRSWQHSTWPDTRTAVSNVKNVRGPRFSLPTCWRVGWTPFSSYSSVVRNGDSKMPLDCQGGTGRAYRAYVGEDDFNLSPGIEDFLSRIWGQLFKDWWWLLSLRARHRNWANNIRLLKPTDMTIHWKALEEHFLMVHFSIQLFSRWKCISEFF
jgi:hypothetical protein